MHHTQFTIKMFNWKKAIAKFLERMFLNLTGLEIFVVMDKVIEKIKKEKRRNKKNEEDV